MKYLEILSGENILRGMKHFSCPAGIRNPIVMVHGYFSATRNGPQRLFIELANRLASLGFTVYRFDLSGMGESDGDIKKITFQKHVEDLNAIIHFVQHEHENQKITLIAHSLGCNLALCQIQQDIHLYHKIFFLAPYLTNTHTLFQIFGDTNKINELEKHKFTYRRGLYVDNSYFIESKVEKFKKLLAETPLTFHIIVGEKDQFIPMELTIEALKNIDNADIVCLPNADHNFLETHEELTKSIIKVLES